MDHLMVLFESVRDFMATGGNVLWLVAAALSVTWILMLERFIFLRTEYPKFEAKIIEQWQARPERNSWTAHRVRETLLSQARVQLSARMTIIAALVAMCPMLGLLGTVTGMINVFAALASSGSGNVRAMAAGVSQATVPTMAGMVGALSGVLLVTLLTRRAAREVEFLEDSLTMDH